MELIQYWQKLYRQVDQHQVALKAKEHDIVQPFVSIRNTLIFFAEIYKMYNNLGQPRLKGPTLPQEEITIRLKSIMRDVVFIPFMSIVEYYTIKLAQKQQGSAACSEIQQRGERRVFLSQLIPLIPELNQEKDPWDFAIALRNDIVHFDAIARQTLSSPVRDFPILMVEGTRAEANLRSFLSLLCHLEECFFKFVEGIA